LGLFTQNSKKLSKIGTQLKEIETGCRNRLQWMKRGERIVMDTAGSFIGVTALINMFLSIVFIGISWWALQIFKFDLFFRETNGPQAKLVQILVSIVIGHGVATFFIDYMQWTTFLKYIFR
jgi:uncharacterized integral membrane protein (TIGR02327 family)